jgi:hypothetical protein
MVDLRQFDALIKENGLFEVLGADYEEDFDDTQQEEQEYYSTDYPGFEPFLKSHNRSVEDLVQRDTMAKPDRADTYGTSFMILANLLRNRVYGKIAQNNSKEYFEFEEAMIEKIYEDQGFGYVNMSQEDLVQLLDRCEIVFDKTFGGNEFEEISNKNFRDVVAVVLASKFKFVIFFYKRFIDSLL